MLGIAALASALLIGNFAPSNYAPAYSMSCRPSGVCLPFTRDTKPWSSADFVSSLGLDAAQGRYPIHSGTPLSGKEFASYSGIGAIVCHLDSQRHTATAFLVGRFDIAVTVAHTFESNETWVTPGHCSYVSTGTNGAILERIPLASIKTQWASEPNTAGQPESDLAVVRLSRPAGFPRSTLPFSKFAHTSARVKMIGFDADFAVNTVKRALRGTVYPRRTRDCVRFAHDIDTSRASAGEPLIDMRNDVVIGIHLRLRAGGSTNCKSRGNAMIPMNDWLERTLRAEISAIPQAAHGEPRESH